MKQELNTVVPDRYKNDVTIVTCGSYARREASEASDLDFYTIIDDDMNLDVIRDEHEWTSLVPEALSKHVAVPSARGGAFDASVVRSSDILRQIGGNSETNDTLTRRMLLLLEGEGIFNNEKTADLRKRILSKYISDNMKDHQLSLFLLNDIIRYYRTICVDFEFKTSIFSRKPWGLRNIKLVFSRKLLYASGLFSVAMTVDRESFRKIELLETLFSMPAIDRIQEICTPHRCEKMLKSYDSFLGRIKEKSVRDTLNEVTSENRSDSALFRELKNEGHHFTRELLKLYELTFDATHPIRKAVIF